MSNEIDFIACYQSADIDRIDFSGNDKHGPELVDANLLFRRAVIKEVRERPGRGFRSRRTATAKRQSTPWEAQSGS